MASDFQRRRSHRNGWEVAASEGDVAASGWEVAAAEPPGRRFGLVRRIWSSRLVNVQVKASRQAPSQEREPTQVLTGSFRVLTGSFRRSTCAHNVTTIGRRPARKMAAYLPEKFRS
jgi:hypothetical protein